MNKNDRDRISATLALAEAATNPSDGERLAAVNATERLLAKAGLRLRDLATSTASTEKKMPELGTWRQTCRDCLQHRQALREWEFGFLTDLPAFKRISTKQSWCLNEIAMRIGVKPRRPE